MNPTGVSGADPATDMTNSAAFAGVQPTAQGTGAGGQGTGNPIVPVNVAPSAPQGAMSMGQGAQAQPSPVFRTEDDVISAARAGQLTKEQAQEILVNQFGFDP
jgi:hypothetical protein